MPWRSRGISCLIRRPPICFPPSITSGRPGSIFGLPTTVYISWCSLKGNRLLELHLSILALSDMEDGGYLIVQCGGLPRGKVTGHDCSSKETRKCSGKRSFASLDVKGIPVKLSILSNSPSMGQRDADGHSSPASVGFGRK